MRANASRKTWAVKRLLTATTVAAPAEEGIEQKVIVSQSRVSMTRRRYTDMHARLNARTGGELLEQVERPAVEPLEERAPVRAEELVGEVAVEEHGQPAEPQQGHHGRDAVAEDHVRWCRRRAFEAEGQREVEHAEDGAEGRELAEDLAGQPVAPHLDEGGERTCVSVGGCFIMHI